jgi:hypothetical protein
MPAVEVGPSWSLSAPVVAAAFDAPGTDSVSLWAFQNGSEFPGASGNLSETAGVSGKAARLAYNFSCGGDYWTALAGRQCGRYVAMGTGRLASSMTANTGDVPSISFDWRNIQATATPTLRVVDSTGQTLQFAVPSRSLENINGTAWQTAIVPIAKSANFWGGAGDGVFHAPLKSLTYMAGGVALPSPAGDIEIDNIRFHKSSEAGFELKPNAPLASVTVPESYVGRIGIAWQPKTGYAALEKAVSVGITVARLDLHWGAVENFGKFDFTYYKNLAAELKKRNVKIVWVLDYGHKDHGGAVPLSVADQAAYAAFARRAALEFLGNSSVIGYEIWNEPNWQPFWPNPDPVAYSSLLKVTVDAMRSVDTVSKISTGGVADIDFEYLMKVLRSGKASRVNAIGLHPYRKSGPESFASQIVTLRKMTAAVGVNAELWDTEWGYSAYGDVGDLSLVGDGHDPRALRRQAVLTVRKVLTAAAINLPLSVLYDMVNDGVNPRAQFRFIEFKPIRKACLFGAANAFCCSKWADVEGFAG